MIEKIPALARLCKELQRVPYLASKNLYRVATYFLKENQERVEQLCATVLAARNIIIACPTCYVWREKGQPCVFCDDPKRDRSVICVVESWQELMAIEKTEGYRGLYHLLGGVICPLEGIGADDLTIMPLAARLKAHPECVEIILAMNQTPEGEATSAFIARTLKDHVIKISCLARGIPVGSHLEMMDKLTMYKALSERRPF